MAETINITNSLKEQQAQLRRLLERKIWVSKMPKATLDEMEAQVRVTKALIADLEAEIQNQRGRA
jgi:hypothetical protein